MRHWQQLGKRTLLSPSSHVTTTIRPSISVHTTFTPLSCSRQRLNFIRAHGTHHHHHHHHHGEEGHVHVDLASTLQQSSKRGMRITLAGLFANVGLTVSKGIAGWMCNSASLLADATHSLSDLLSDFTTLYTFKMSRKPPDALYPYGYGKFETMGSLAVAGFLLAGGAGIGIHSFDLLLAVINPAMVQEAAAVATQESSSGFFHHHHHHGDVLDPNAAWYALASVIIKEGLYRATLKVGKEERSNVLIANAWHHRSDAYSSIVSLVAIVGSYAGIPVLDPIGGLIVSAMIIKSGNGILMSSLRELMDKGMDHETITDISQAITEIKKKEHDLLGFHSLRGRKQGPFHHVDLVLRVDRQLPMHKAHHLEQVVQDSIKRQFPDIQQVMIYLETKDNNNTNNISPPPSPSQHQHHH
ncbi:hypothetical protein LRAMOSA02663 [Lichtheimia ramosa]|uniref:Uncharacterized protein n=1 Tax=Lichtheimia ramosa TaxID=688394 RepID=A0A077WQU5_9FUNG|nr:hypothetical protein LRAMOSA02663 [Lichtheimia ramosa]